MLLLNTRLTNVPVMSLQTGSSLGTATEPIIDPRKLQIVAYHVAGPRIHEPSVVHATDIREVGPLGFIVDGADTIMSLDDHLVRLQEVLEFNFTLTGKQVIDERGKKLGKVTEYSVDSESMFIQKLHVAQSLMKNLGSSNVLIHRSQIVEVNDRHIIVRSGTVQQPVGLGRVLNPFRKAQPQLKPESSRRFQ